MQTLGDLTRAELETRLETNNLRIHVGPYVYAIHSSLSTISDGLSTLYSEFAIAKAGGFADYHISIRPPNALQKLRGKVDFFIDDQRPFNRIDLSQAWAFLEWGMNWCVSVRANEYLKLHAAVVAKDDIAVVMPGLPGAGKSTLCAALAVNGWRVLSDEHALVQTGTSQVVPLCRPVSLKNESIEIMQAYSPKVVLGPKSLDTHKGRVAHMKADLSSGSHCAKPISARFLIFPKYTANEKLVLSTRSAAESFMFAAHHSFNYSTLGAVGYEAMASFVDEVLCFDLGYNDLDEAVEVMNGLHDQVVSE